MLTDSEDVTERWREYIEELYAKDEKRTFIPLEQEEEVDIDSIGPDLLREGIRQLADWLVLFVCFNLAVASGLFCSGLGKRASQTREKESAGNCQVETKKQNKPICQLPNALS